MISGILAGGIPGFRIELCCFLHPSSGPWCVCGFSVVVLCYGPANMTHKLSSACAEMILSYHLSPQQICFTHKLETVTSRFCGFVVVFLLCGFFLLLGFVSVLFLLLVLCFSVFVLRFCSLERDKPLDYVSVLFQFTFAATTALAPA